MPVVMSGQYSTRSAGKMGRKLLFAMALAAAGAASAQENLRPDSPVAFVGAMLADGYEAAPIHDAAVVIDGNRIVAAAARHEVEIPADAQIIELGGRTILPGLIDAHVHMDLIGHGDYDRYYRFLGGKERLDEVMPIAAKQLIRAGVTSAVDLGTPFDILELREAIRAGRLPGPRLTISGPWITRVYLEGAPDSYQLLIDSPREAEREARWLIEQGADIIKTWEGITREDFDAIVGVAREHGVAVHAHLYDPGMIRDALAAGVDVFQHVGSARNPPYDADIVSAIAHRGIPVVQTISHRIRVYPATEAFPGRLNDPQHYLDMPPDVAAEVRASFDQFHRLSYFHEIGLEVRNARLASRQFIDAGAVIGVGTDAASPMNFHTEAMWFELKALVESGMSPLAALSAATRTNAAIIGRASELGTVEPGKLADLVVVRGNPLADIDAMKRVELTVRDGVVWYPGTNRDPAVARVGRPLDP